MNDQTVIAASGAVNEAPIRRMPGWHGPDETPDVPRGADQFFQIAVRRKHSDKVFSFPAVYCNSYAVTVEYDPSESQGNRWSMHFLAEDMADEGELGCSGWWDIKSDNEYEFHFTPALAEGDELVGWCELPQWGDAEPPKGLLVSMAMRLNHGFGGDDAPSQEVQLADMRRCWEEVTGRGFYRAELDAQYRSHLNPMQEAAQSAEDGQA